MSYKKSDVKSVLLAVDNLAYRDMISGILQSKGYRVIKANNLLSVIESLENYQIHLLISEVELPEISMINFLPFLRKRYPDLKVIITMKDYSPETELSLRPYKILYVFTWPIEIEILKSVVEKGLKIQNEEIVSLFR